MTEQQICPKCAENIPEGAEKCPSCGMAISQDPIDMVRKATVPTRTLWFAAILICVGIVSVATLAFQLAFSGVNTMSGAMSEGRNAEFAVSNQEKEFSGAKDFDTAAPKKDETHSLIELPSEAVANGYIVLEREITAKPSGDKLQFKCAVKNISNVACTDVGVKVEFFDASEQMIGSSGSWVYNTVQPGEVVELSFEGSNAKNIAMYRLNEVGGEPVSQGNINSSEPEAEDDRPRLTTEQIASAMGDDPESWVTQQVGEKFVVTGQLVKLTPSDDGLMVMVQIGKGQGACYVFFFDTMLFSKLEQIPLGTEVCISGNCMQMPNMAQLFVLINGLLEE